MVPSEAETAYAAITEAVNLIEDPGARQSAYADLIGSVLKLSFAVPGVIATLIVGLGGGDRDNFIAAMPDLVRLVCRTGRDTTLRLETEIQEVEALLSA
jgi:hypothetical protein